MNTNCQRQYERYQILDPSQVTATVTWQSDRGERALCGCVCDLSRSGVKLILDESIPAGTLCRVKVDQVGGSGICASTATVCWFRPDGPLWSVGCNFDAILPIEVFGKLSAQHLIDRRRDNRLRAQGTIAAKLECAEGIVPLELVNYSAGGFAVSSPCELKIGERVLLLTDSDRQLSVLGRVLWQQGSGADRIVGCDFVNRDGHPLLRRYLVNLQDAENSAPSRRRSWLGIAAGFIVLALGIWQIVS